MFVIHPWAPLYPKLVGKPVDTQGEFPQSVTYSAQLNTGVLLDKPTIRRFLNNHFQPAW